jgi:hypothetical protein
MSKLEELKPNAAVRGILPDGLATVVSVQWFGSEALELTYKTAAGKVANELPYRHDFRIVHVANLDTILRRAALHATNHVPNYGLPYRTIHNVDIQNVRHGRTIPCGPRGTIHDYVPFYFGYLSPMLLQLKTGRVTGYNEGQEPLIYLASNAQAVASGGCRFVFSNGHGYTDWFDSLDQLENVDWNMVYQSYWRDEAGGMDRQRRKQAEFLVHQTCSWGFDNRNWRGEQDCTRHASKTFKPNSMKG